MFLFKQKLSFDRFLNIIILVLLSPVTPQQFEPRREKSGLWGFRPGQTQTGLYSNRRKLEALNFGLTKENGCNIHVVKTKAVISYCKADMCLYFRRGKNPFCFFFHHAAHFI